MVETPENYRQIAKLLRTLNKRSALIRKQSKYKQKSTWPTSSVYSLLNNTENMQKTITKPIQSCLSKKNHKSEKELTKTRMKTNISVFDFDRPYTCEDKARSIKPALKKQSKTQSTWLFNSVKQQKLVLLQEEKQQLVKQIFNREKAVIHRIDQDQEHLKKPNAINFKTYFSLNRLMDLSDKISFTANCRPKTGGDRLKKVKQSSPFI